MNANGFIYKQFRSLYLYQKLDATSRRNIKSILMRLEAENPDLIAEYGDWHDPEPVTPAPVDPVTPTPADPTPAPTDGDASPVTRKGWFEAPLFYQGEKELKGTWDFFNMNTVSDRDRELCLANIKALTAEGNTGFMAVVPTPDCGCNLYKGSTFQGAVNATVQAFYRKWANRISKAGIQLCVTPYCDDPNAGMLWWPKIAEHKKFIQDLYEPVKHLAPWFCLSIETNELAYSKEYINDRIKVLKSFLPGVPVGCHLQVEGRSRVAPQDYAWLTDRNNTSPADTDFILVEMAGPPQNGKNKSLTDITAANQGLNERQTIHKYIVHEWYLESKASNADYTSKRSAVHAANKNNPRYLGRG